MSSRNWTARKWPLPGDITSAVRAKQSQATFPVMLVRERREMTVNVTLDATSTAQTA